MNNITSLKLSVELDKLSIQRYVRIVNGEAYVEYDGREYPLIDDGLLLSEIDEVNNGCERVVFTDLWCDVPTDSISFVCIFKDCSKYADNDSVELGSPVIEDITPLNLPTLPFDAVFEEHNNDHVWSELYDLVRNKRKL